MEKTRSKRQTRWLWRILLIALAVWVADESLSLLLRYNTRLNRRITVRLEAAFGRAVEVGNYDFSLFPTPRLVAESITVAEDTRFGNEYFLRAESLAASLRWRSLLRGRVELGTLSLTRPSLNLVHGANDRWNLEDWLPREPAPTAGGSATSAAPAKAAPRLTRIDVSAGRINFKEGALKLPLALVAVDGHVEQESPGRWRLDLEARPMRAAVVVQEAGTLTLRGVVGGTSFRLRPADLELAWQDAALPDMLRLLRGRDYGLRGSCMLLLTARSEGPEWSLVASAQARRVHRWDLPERADNPAVNVDLSASWRPEESRIELAQALVEAPRSNLRATGAIGWRGENGVRHGDIRDMRLELRSANLHLSDVLAWYRAFHPGVAEELTADGGIGVNATLAGWPPHVERGVVTLEGGRIEGGSLSEPIRVGRMSAHIEAKQLTLSPATIAFGLNTGTIHVEGSAHSGGSWMWDTRATGQFAEVQDLLGAAGALGVSVRGDWTIEGPAKFDLRWQNATVPFRDSPSGRIELDRAALRAKFLNQPVRDVTVSAELRAGQQRVRIDSAEAFGARWSGTLERGAGGAWNCSLAAERLDAADLDRWLNPQWRESLLQRVLPFLGGSASSATAPAGFSAAGEIRVGTFLLAPLELHRLRAEISVTDRHIEVEKAQADFYGGSLHGSARAEFGGGPAYEVEAKFERVNIADLLRGSPSLQNRFSGTATGELSLTARGLGRAALLGSLTGRGSVEVRDARLRGFDLDASLRSQSRRPGESAFQRASGRFSIGGTRLQFAKLQLGGAKNTVEAAGTIDFSRTVDMRVHFLAPGASAAWFRLAGPLDSFQLTRVAADASR